jgi:hypothetical protein
VVLQRVTLDLLSKYIRFVQKEHDATLNKPSAVDKGFKDLQAIVHPTLIDFLSFQMYSAKKTTPEENLGSVFRHGKIVI